VPALVVVNKATAAPEAANRIAAAVRARGVEAVATVPYDRAVVAAVRAGRPVGVGARGPASVALEALSAHLSTWLAGGGVSAPAASPMPSATARPHRR
jgi:MinD superfamily P-loop ATPase